MSDITTDPRPWPTVDGRELTPDEVRASEDCEHEWSGPLDKHPTCLNCNLPYEVGDKAEAPCARYWGSDGTLCSTHHDRFASDDSVRCEAGGKAAPPPTTGETNA